MLTGDNEKIAINIANRVGIDNVEANLLLENKLDIVKDVQKQIKMEKYCLLETE